MGDAGIFQGWGEVLNYLHMDYYKEGEKKNITAESVTVLMYFHSLGYLGCWSG